MTQRKSWRRYGFGLLVLAAGGCGASENIAEHEPTPETSVSTPPAARTQAGSSAPARSPSVLPPAARPAEPSVFPPSVMPPGSAGTCAVPPTASGGFVGMGPSGVVTPELAGATVRATTPPPPISGGTLLATRDGSLLVAADPERDQLYFVDVKTEKLLHVRPLLAGDEPGRVLEDAQGRIHVVLRGGRSIATLTRDAQSTITRREVCAVPRGIGYDATHDQLHVACAEGTLVTLAAAPSGTVSRRLQVGSDARDVLVRGDQLFVTHFRSAQLDVIGANGERLEAMRPATFTREETRFELSKEQAQVAACNGVPFEVQPVTEQVASTPNVAWRAIDVPNMGVAMLHQRSRTAEVQVTEGGYGAGSCGSGIVQTALTVGLDKPAALSADLGALSLAVDIASSADGEVLAIVAPGNFGTQQQIHVLPASQLMAPTSGTPGLLPTGAVPGKPLPDGSGGTGSNPTTPVRMDPDANPCIFTSSALPEPPGQVTAVTFASPHLIAVQQREPAAITLYDLRTSSASAQIDLQQASTADTGHSLFHLRAGAGVACASCHPEAGDDGHVWTFRDIGARRTQFLRGGLLGTEPFHWNGDMKDFSMLMSEVFVRRMGGFQPRADQAQALATWLDKQPAQHADARDEAAAARGKALFESKDVGCSDCHSGLHRTNNQSRNVGTGAELQVPPLKSLALRTPLMHDGCATTIGERLTDAKCGGGDAHGRVSQLSAAQLGDLTFYLETL